jgi:GTP-binding protein
MTQTKFVLSKALKRQFKPLVVINKADRDTAQFDKVDNDLFDLFVSLEATDEQMEYPVIFASAKAGWATLDMAAPTQNMNTLFEKILSHFEAPRVDRETPFSLLVTQMDKNPYLGKTLLGKIQTGTVKVGTKIKALTPEGKMRSEGRITKIYYRRGLEQVAARYLLFLFA